MKYECLRKKKAWVFKDFSWFDDLMGEISLSRRICQMLCCMYNVLRKYCKLVIVMRNKWMLPFDLLT